MSKGVAKFILLSVLLLNVKNSSATNLFLIKKSLCDSCENNLNFRFESSSFLKNNEYAGNFANGFTGIGVMLKPTLEYYFNQKTKLNLGAFGLKYSGLNGFSQLIPIYQIHHKVVNGFELVLGNLYGNLNHDLAEPLYRFDYYYLDNVEYGVQLLHESKYVNSDLWLNWEKFIFEGDPFQEEFTLGNHTNIKLFSRKHIKLKGDFQYLVYHKGGEIDSYIGPAFCVFNGSYGFDIQFNSKKITCSLKPKFLTYKNQRAPADAEFYKYSKDGNGILFSGDFEHPFLYVETGYWKGDRFVSPMGEYLYMSASESDSNLYQENRQIFFTKFRLKRHMSDNLKLELRANLYVDLKNNALPDYSYGIYFIANELFFLQKIKKRKSLKGPIH